MKYYIIVGEASGDLHASHLMAALKKVDANASFRFIGGDLMIKEGGECLQHYQTMAYMGFIPVLLNLRTILNNMKQCKKDIVSWNPDVVILVDYPGFNLDIAKFLKRNTNIPAFYYISPKIWAWKEWRIKAIKRDIAELFSILPFEVSFFEKKHNYPIHYVGNPTADEIRLFRNNYQDDFNTFATAHSLPNNKPIIALLAGSRKQEIKDNLPAMIQAASAFTNYQMVLAGAPSIDKSYYLPFIEGHNVTLIENNTYALLSHATAALVTSGTATLETALFNVPQVVCYKTPIPPVIRFAFNHIIKVKYISLVNLILDKEAVAELFADRFVVSDIQKELQSLLIGGDKREEMLNNYELLHAILGDEVAHDNAARIMFKILNDKTKQKKEE